MIFILSSLGSKDRPKFNFKVHPGEPMSLSGLLTENWKRVTDRCVGDPEAVTLKGLCSVCMRTLYSYIDLFVLFCFPLSG